MGQSINLIPEQEKQEQAKTQLVKTSSVVSILLCIVAVGISGYLFYQVQSLKNEGVNHDQQIESLRGDIKKQTSIEIIARNLDSKYKVLDEILRSRLYYSMLLQEFQARLPETITVDDFSITQNSAITITGTADTYISIAQFINALANRKFVGGTPGLEALFSSVSLNTVTTENSISEIKFFIVVTYDLNLLKKL